MKSCINPQPVWSKRCFITRGWVHSNALPGLIHSDAEYFWTGSLVARRRRGGVKEKLLHMQSVTCLFSRKQSQTPRLLSKVWERGNRAQNSLCSSRDLAPSNAGKVKIQVCWVGRMITAEKPCNYKDQPGFRLGPFYLKAHLNLSPAEFCWWLYSVFWALSLTFSFSFLCLFCAAPEMYVWNHAQKLQKHTWTHGESLLCTVNCTAHALSDMCHMAGVCTIPPPCALNTPSSHCACPR